MPTQNYKFTYIDDTHDIDIANDTNAFLDEIDAQMKTNADTAASELDASFPIGSDDIQPNSIGADKLVNGSVTTSKLADGCVTGDKLAQGAVTSESVSFADNSVDAKFLRDGTITATKLSKTGFDALLGGITIRRFDNQDSKADNAGMDKVGDTNWRVAGFYIPAFGVVVITRFEKFQNVEWPSSKTFALPSYIPKSSAKYNIGYATRYNSSSDFSAWAYLSLTTSGAIEPSTANDSDGYIIGGALVFKLSGNSNTASLQNYNDANGVI